MSDEYSKELCNQYREEMRRDIGRIENDVKDIKDSERKKNTLLISTLVALALNLLWMFLKGLV